MKKPNWKKFVSRHPIRTQRIIINGLYRSFQEAIEEDLKENIKIIESFKKATI